MKRRDNICLTQEARDMIIGSLFGDAWCGYNPVYGKTPYLSFGHRFDDVDYLIWKRDVLVENGLACTPPRNKYRDGKLYMVYFDTQRHPIIKEFYDLFYPNGKKIISQEALNQVTPQALAVWYMDDGSIDQNKHYKSGIKAIHIATASFSSFEHDLMQEYFYNNYGVEAKPIRLYWDGKHYLNIAIYKKKDMAKFFNIVGNYIHPCMSRKVKRR